MRLLASEPTGRVVLAGFAALALLAILPVLAVGLPPILDYPNHLARMHVLAGLAQSEILQGFYQLAWAPLPNLALDAIVPWLGRILPMADAMRVFLALVLLGLAGGVLALHRAVFQRWSFWPLAAFLLLYNRMLLWGFLNYLAGLALALWALAAWIALERRAPLPRIALGAVLATAIYLSHLAAFGFYAVALLAFAAAPPEGGSPRPAVRRLLEAGVTLIPAAILFLLSPTSGASAGIGYGNFLRKFDLPVSIFDNYNRVFDGATFAVVAIATIVALVHKNLIVQARLRWSLIALIAVYLAMPSRFLSASGIDHRLPIAIALLFVGASDWSGVAARLRLRIAVAGLALFAVRLAVVGGVWVHADRLYDSLAAGFDEIPRGARLAVAAPSSGTQAGGAPLLHFPTLAVVLRDAFVPSLFADPAQQPIRFTADAMKLAAENQPAPLWDALAAGKFPALPDFDDLAVIDPPATFDPAAFPGTVIFESPRMLLIKLGPAPLKYSE